MATKGPRIEAVFDTLFTRPAPEKAKKREYDDLFFRRPGSGSGPDDGATGGGGDYGDGGVNYIVRGCKSKN